MRDRALGDLFRLHQRRVQSYLNRRLGNADLAADLTQETFLRFAERDRSAIHQDSSYLLRMAHNLAIDHLRQQRRRRQDFVDPDTLAHIADDRPSQENAAHASLKLASLRRIVGQLPARTQLIFELNRVEGLSYLEVAERLGISESSVQKHLARALQHILAHMEPE